MARGFPAGPRGIDNPACVSSLARPMLRRISFVFALLSVGALADPVAEMAAFASLKNVDLAKLSAGEVQTGRGPTMSFPRGLAIESAFVVKAPIATNSHTRCARGTTAAGRA